MADYDNQDDRLTPEEPDAAQRRTERERRLGNLVDGAAEAGGEALRRAVSRQQAAQSAVRSAAPGGTSAGGVAAGGFRAGVTDVAAEAATSGVGSTAGAAAGATAGAAIGIGGAVLGEAGNFTNAVRSRDGVGVADAGVRAAAVGVASVYGTPLFGAALGAALNTRAGRKLSRGTTWLLVAALTVVGLMVAAVVVTPMVAGAAVSVIAASESNQGPSSFDGIVCVPVTETPYDDPADKPNSDSPVTVSDDGQSCTINLEGIDPRYVMRIPSNTAYRDAGAYPKAPIALDRAFSVVGNAGLACSDGRCYRMCDGLAGWIWGYDNSGYASAQVHWDIAVRQGVAHPGSRDVPIGALVFWAGGPYGHVATYVGNGMVVSNVSNGPSGSNVYLMGADTWDAWNGGRYLGWAEPIFRGAKLPQSGFWE
jgi:hypothetical protein